MQPAVKLLAAIMAMAVPVSKKCLFIVCSFLFFRTNLVIEFFVGIGEVFLEIQYGDILLLGVCHQVLVDVG